MATLERQIEEAARLVADAGRVIVFTGAGVSTESGIPDFRGSGGLWSRYDPEDFTIERFLSDRAVRVKHWQLLTGNEFIVADAEPNPGHYAIRAPMAPLSSIRLTSAVASVGL